MKRFHHIARIAAALCLLLPASAFADRKRTYYRDLDGDGHYNKKTYEHRHRGYHGRGYSGYHRPYYYNRPYYGRSYYGGYGYGGYGYPYYGSSLGFSYVSRPSYYTSSRVYRGRTAGYADELAADVQSALRRRGYYRGPIDGDIGPGSRAAIRAYQAERGLAVTGRIDSSLLRSLGVG